MQINLRKRLWSPEEDFLLQKLVEKYGPGKWTVIAEQMEGRAGKQCRQRWHNHLDPLIRKGQWTQQEEWLLFLAHKKFGNSWAKISKELRGRTDNSIKNHWNSAMKKKIPLLQDKFLSEKPQLSQTQLQKRILFLISYGLFDQAAQACQKFSSLLQIVSLKERLSLGNWQSLLEHQTFKQVLNSLQVRSAFKRREVGKEDSESGNTSSRQSCLIKGVQGVVLFDHNS